MLHLKGVLFMHTLRFDGTTAQNYDLTSFLDSKLRDIPDGEDIALDLSGLASLKIKRELQVVFKKIAHYNVVKIDLSGAEIGEIESKQIAEAIKSHATLRTVVLNNNNIRNEGATSLAKAMEVNPQLDISLVGNKISKEGAVAFVKAAVKAGKGEIDLSSNNLGDLGAKAVALELKASSNNIKALYLRHNKIAAFGDKHLARETPAHIKVYYRSEVGSIWNSCPGVPRLLKVASRPLDYLLSYVVTHVDEPEGCISKG